MKSLITSFLTLAFSANAFATTVRVPVLVQNDDTDEHYSMAQINPLLKQKGLKTFPEYLELSDSKTINYKAVSSLFAAIDKELEKAGLHYSQLNELHPTVHSNVAPTCFTGDARKVPDILNQLIDVEYSDQMNTHGWKYKGQTVIVQDFEDADQYLSKSSEKWAHWNKNSDSILILYAVGDGGDDVNEAIIPPCK